MKSILNNKTILVTGGTGSFGQKFTAHILAKYYPKKVIIFSRDEYKQYVMCQAFNQDDNKLRFFLGDVRDKERLARAFEGVDIVVHAAALKQVPTLEYNPIEAIKTNIMGAVNVIDAAIDKKVKIVIALSTDKAVNPINIYGGTKFVSDKLFVAANSYSHVKNTRFAVVRYGNVAGSRGSVIPLFQELAKKNAPLKITNREMTRFWLSLDAAVNLVIEAIKNAQGGEIYVAKCPSFCIMDLAKTISPNAKIEEIGTRPGEKIHETMITEDDAPRTYEFKNNFIIYPLYSPWGTLKIPTGKYRKVAKNFKYASNTNSEWLKPKDIKNLL